MGLHGLLERSLYFFFFAILNMNPTLRKLLTVHFTQNKDKKVCRERVSKSK
jgi:hypothetical protein